MINTKQGEMPGSHEKAPWFRTHPRAIIHGASVFAKDSPSLANCLLFIGNFRRKRCRLFSFHSFSLCLFFFYQISWKESFGGNTKAKETD